MKFLLVVLLAFCASCSMVQITPVNYIATIEIEGGIDDKVAERIAATVADINSNSSIKGVFITVESGGGDAQSSKLIYEEIAKLKVPAVAWCDHMCASGAYYAIATPSVKF